jgi:hypothetical protein
MKTIIPFSATWLVCLAFALVPSTHARAAMTNVAWYRLGENERAEVRKIVAIHGCDDGMLELHLSDRGGDPRRLLDVVLWRPPVRHGAVRAVPRAHVAQHHERGRAVLPALTDVGAVGFLADGVQVEVAHQLLESQVLRATRSANFEPARLSLGQRFDAVSTGDLV